MNQRDLKESRLISAAVIVVLLYGRALEVFAAPSYLPLQCRVILRVKGVAKGGPRQTN